MTLTVLPLPGMKRVSLIALKPIRFLLPLTSAEEQEPVTVRVLLEPLMPSESPFLHSMVAVVSPIPSSSAGNPSFFY